MKRNPDFPTIRPKQFFHTPRWHFILSMPFIYAIIPPMVVFDLMMEIYHHVCFPLYGLHLVSRKKYFYFDHKDLPRLSLAEKINCAYCGYANGLAAYFVAIAGETEAYWCAIKHHQKESLITQPHTANFLDPKKFK